MVEKSRTARQERFEKEEAAHQAEVERKAALKSYRDSLATVSRTGPAILALRIKGKRERGVKG